jgi:hypothetical protein
MRLKLYHVEEIELDEKATYDFLLAKANGKALEWLNATDNGGTLVLQKWTELLD